MISEAEARKYPVAHYEPLTYAWDEDDFDIIEAEELFSRSAADARIPLASKEGEG